ncbi:MAG: Gfo/Idh/MocA family protein, partial [Planctomycetota bacterium]
MRARKQYGVGMLGFGFIGKAHAYSHITMPYFYDELPFRARFVGVCTGHEETARKARDEYDFTFGTTDAAEVIESDEVDVVHICNPNSLHREELLGAIDAGKHIYCEKPLALNFEQA